LSEEEQTNEGLTHYGTQYRQNAVRLRSAFSHREAEILKELRLFPAPEYNLSIFTIGRFPTIPMSILFHLISAKFGLGRAKPRPQYLPPGRCKRVRALRLGQPETRM
jgi:hypothetical protein